MSLLHGPRPNRTSQTRLIANGRGDLVSKRMLIWIAYRWPAGVGVSFASRPATSGGSGLLWTRVIFVSLSDTACCKAKAPTMFER